MPRAEAYRSNCQTYCFRWNGGVEDMLIYSLTHGVISRKYQSVDDLANCWIFEQSSPKQLNPKAPKDVISMNLAQ